jgi:hypothetical protein
MFLRKHSEIKMINFYRCLCACITKVERQPSTTRARQDLPLLFLRYGNPQHPSLSRSADSTKKMSFSFAPRRSVNLDSVP